MYVAINSTHVHVYMHMHVFGMSVFVSGLYAPHGAGVEVLPGYAFTLPLFSLLGGCRVGCYAPALGVDGFLNS